MNIRDLKYFIALAQEKNFTRASEKCFVSQPTLSMQIKKLEDELSLRLLERDKKNIRLTPAGERIYAHALQVIANVDALKAAAQQNNDPLCGEIRLALIPTLAPFLLSLVLPRFKRHLPHIQWQLTEQTTDMCLDQLHHANCEAVLTAENINNSRIKSIPLFTEDFMVAHHIHEKLSKKTKIAIEDLAADRILLLTEGHCLRDQSLALCKQISSQTANPYAATSLTTLMAMVQLGEGITLLPALATKHWSHKDINYTTLQKPIPSRTIYLNFRQQIQKDVLFEKIAAQIIKAVSQKAGVCAININ